MKVSWNSMRFYCGYSGTINSLLNKADDSLRILNYKNLLECFKFSKTKTNMEYIVRLFDKNEFKDGDLLKDFAAVIGLEWDDNFKYPQFTNETLNMLGFEILSRANGLVEKPRVAFALFRKHFIFNDKDLKFMPPKEVYQSYIDYFEESNEWVRKEFFPHKERLFPEKDLSNYKENYELKEMKPEYWDRIAEFIADIVKTKNQTIADKTTIIQNKDKLITQNTQELQTTKISLDSLKQELTSKTQELTQTKNQLDSTKIQLNSTQKELDSTKQQLDSKVKELDSKTKELSSLHTQKQTLEIKNLEQDNLLKQIQIQEAKQDLINKQLHTKQLEKELGYESNVLKELELKNQQLTQTKNQLDSTKKELESKNKILSSNPNPSHPIQNTPNFKGKLAYLNTLTTAKDRIHNHLSYKLGQAMIENSKSLLGYIRMPYVLSYIKEKHKQEQQQYQEAIKKNPNLKLPNLESYPDYKESLKEKECLAYKLGEAFIKASKTWYKGGYVKLWFEAKRLEREYREKRVERG
ncbi:hypothetical protein [Helicobacter pullorum]|uniref:hypothetical protein n=1 Tax=Helicobacter pullorum TaxID=35818 RepID=UPI00211C0BEF|nr:hypothetical protein [Helicobacter pullorum]